MRNISENRRGDVFCLCRSSLALFGVVAFFAPAFDFGEALLAAGFLIAGFFAAGFLGAAAWAAAMSASTVVPDMAAAAKNASAIAVLAFMLLMLFFLLFLKMERLAPYLVWRCIHQTQLIVYHL